MATETTRIRNYEGGDVFQIVRLFYETVRSVNRADYSEEQVRAWAPEIPDPEAWHARRADRRTLLAEGHGGVIGVGELEGDGHLDMLYSRKGAVGRGVGSLLYQAIEREAREQDRAHLHRGERHGPPVLRAAGLSRGAQADGRAAGSKPDELRDGEDLTPNQRRRGTGRPVGPGPV